MCASNLRQIGNAFVAYTHDNEDLFPFHADLNGEHPEDWIWWEPDRVKMVERSPIMAYVGGKNTDVLVCRLDDLAHYRVIGSYGPYPFSYTFNTLLASNGPSIIANSTHGPRMTQILNAGDKIMLVEEDPATIDDGNWAPTLFPSNIQNDISIRHDHKLKPGADDSEYRGNVALADGHVEFVSRKYSRDPRHYDPLR